MPSPSATDMDTSSQYSSCETLDSHRSSECDEKNEVNGNAQKSRKVKRCNQKKSSIRSLNSFLFYIFPFLPYRFRQSIQTIFEKKE